MQCRHHGSRHLKDTTLTRSTTSAVHSLHHYTLLLLNPSCSSSNRLAGSRGPKWVPKGVLLCCSGCGFTCCKLCPCSSSSRSTSLLITINLAAAVLLCGCGSCWAQGQWDVHKPDQVLLLCC